MGRKSTYTVELANEICEALQDGQSLNSVCDEMGLSEGTVRTWVRDREDFATKYARAREIGDDVEFERLTAMASEEPKQFKGMVDQGWVAWKRNQVDAFKWSLSKKRPGKYGDKITQELTGESGGPLKFVVEHIGTAKD